ncbi:uncharacterized protein LOC122506681 [Leptopilina heterotoma]|uniref:uncharacterized protein LOC122506681 n=1 Tax=Leptopilina heterotoma TaxID=63436 RepID=UPI001CA96514|nr:uncharacterized protein LOC122506681 [Leptopilina heterotoma]
MDALELQAALVKLDPATTVTPIGSSVKLMVPHSRIAFKRDVDESELSTISHNNQIITTTATINNTTTSTALTTATTNVQQKTSADRKLLTNLDTMNVRKLPTTTTTTNQNHQNSQNPQITKCNVIEVR